MIKRRKKCESLRLNFDLFNIVPKYRSTNQTFNTKKKQTKKEKKGNRKGYVDFHLDMSEIIHKKRARTL